MRPSRLVGLVGCVSSVGALVSQPIARSEQTGGPAACSNCAAPGRLTANSSAAPRSLPALYSTRAPAASCLCWTTPTTTAGLWSSCGRGEAAGGLQPVALLSMSAALRTALQLLHCHCVGLEAEECHRRHGVGIELHACAAWMLYSWCTCHLISSPCTPHYTPSPQPGGSAQLRHNELSSGMQAAQTNNPHIVLTPQPGGGVQRRQRRARQVAGLHPGAGQPHRRRLGRQAEPPAARFGLACML